MKNVRQITLTLLYVALMILSIDALADNEQYQAVMKKNIQALYEAKTQDEYQASINAFQRIAAVEKEKWEPHYYSAFGYVMMAAKGTTAAEKDANLDLALELIKKAAVLSPDESEIIALQGFVYMIRVSIDPASRGAQFAGQAMQYFQRALKMNPENPRALCLLGQMQFGSAQFFGSSTDEACSTINAALVKFDTFKSENPLAPQWGRQMTERLKQSCK
jgi:tetratricopeptide (TPR) repeat protein